MEPQRRAAKKSGEPIAFRPEQEIYDQLNAKAEILGMSIHQLACHYVTGMVRGNSGDKAPVEQLPAMMAELREDLAISVEILLSLAGKARPQDARKWADENLRS